MMGNNRLTVNGTGFSVSFDSTTGFMTSLVYSGRAMITPGEGMIPNWYRSVSNDKYSDQKYYTTSYSARIFDWSASGDGKSVTVVVDGEALIAASKPVVLPYTMRYRVWAGGAVDVDASFTKSSDAEIIRRLGLRLTMPEGYENVRWYGYGPHENYPDRMAAAIAGIWETTVDGMASEHYVRAQSLGNREGVRWFTVTDGEGRGLKVTSREGMSFSALHYEDSALWEAEHDFTLPEIRKPEVFVSMDRIQQGLGNATCGPLPLPVYMIPENVPLSYSFRIEKE
jgi:beta-galactosidase